MLAKKGAKRGSSATGAAKKRSSLIREDPALQALLTSPELVSVGDGFKGRLGAQRQAVRAEFMTRHLVLTGPAFQAALAKNRAAAEAAHAVKMAKTAQKILPGQSPSCTLRSRRPS